jgi:AcrR family transcriptional regulator
METTNRQNIIQIALDLFAAHGYEATGVQAIADLAGISKPTLYHYFGSKRGLLDAIIGEHGQPMFDLVDQGARYNHDLVMNLTIITRGVITFALSDKAFYRLYQTLSAAAPESHGYAASEPLRTAISSRLEELFVEAVGDHGNMKGRQTAYSHAFQGMYNTWALLVINKKIELTDEVLHRAVHQYMHGIFS